MAQAIRFEKTGDAEVSCRLKEARSLRQRFALWLALRREQRQLAAMSDRELHDIGITRPEAEVQGPGFWQCRILWPFP